MTEACCRRTMRQPDFPLDSPRQLRRPFSAATGSGRFFFLATAAHASRSGRPDAEPVHMGLAAAHPISPELALVCPELREQAVRLLPPLDPDVLFEVEPRYDPAPPPRPRLVAVPPQREPETQAEPEVEPEPKAPLPVAVVAYATEALLLGALRAVGLVVAITLVAFILAR